MSKNNIHDLMSEEKWNDSWKTHGHPNAFRANPLFYLQFDRLMTKYLGPGRKKFLEVGCGGGKLLVYFARRFNYDVFGIDYSKTGSDLAKENLLINNMSGTVICDDVFTSNRLNKESFDVVFSGGFIEHFEQTGEVLKKHIEFLKPGGMLIISLPNMNGLHGFIFRMFNPKSFHSHKKITAELLDEELQGLNIKTIESKYIGSLMLESGGKPKFMQYLFYIFNRIIYWLVRILHISFNSRFVSPYIVVIGQKLSR